MRIAAIILLLLTPAVAAQIRPTPQAPPRRTAPAPRPTPPPKRESSEPTENKTTPPPAQAKAAESTSSDAGAALYKKNGCYECHVNDAQGGPQGPRLGP